MLLAAPADRARASRDRRDRRPARPRRSAPRDRFLPGAVLAWRSPALDPSATAEPAPVSRARSRRPGRRPRLRLSPRGLSRSGRRSGGARRRHRGPPSERHEPANLRPSLAPSPPDRCDTPADEPGQVLRCLLLARGPEWVAVDVTSGAFVRSRASGWPVVPTDSSLGRRGAHKRLRRSPPARTVPRRAATVGPELGPCRDRARRGRRAGRPGTP